MRPLLDPAERFPVHGASTRITGTFWDDEDAEHTISADYERVSGRPHWEDIEIDGAPLSERALTSRQEQALLKALEALA
jgi:predicted DNA binding protein